MLGSIAKLLVKEVLRGYIDILGIVVMLIGLCCFILASILAIYDEPRFAILFTAIGASLIILGFAGAKLFERLVDRA